ATNGERKSATSIENSRITSEPPSGPLRKTPQRGTEPESPKAGTHTTSLATGLATGLASRRVQALIQVAQDPRRDTPDVPLTVGHGVVLALDALPLARVAL